LVPDILSRHSVTTKESPRSRVALEEARHFLGGSGRGVREVGVISFDRDLEDGAVDYDYNKRVGT